MERFAVRKPVLVYGFAIIGPGLLTWILIPLRFGDARAYVFLYMALVAILGMFYGLIPALGTAATSFLFVDYFFVPPIHTFTIGDQTDMLNLVAFFGAAGAVGSLASLRRGAQLQTEHLAHELTAVNKRLEKMNKEQAEAALVSVRLAHTQQQVNMLKESDRIRRELLANISHELRTPITSILLGTTSLLDRTSLDPDVRSSLEQITKEEQRLSRLVGDILDMARIEGAALDLHFDVIDLNEACAAAVERFHIHTQKRTIEMQAHDTTFDVIADWHSIGQMLDNLLLNADRFAPEGTPITIALSKGHRGLAIVHVIDQGPGVPPELAEAIFDRFVSLPGNLPPGTDRPGGVGLGLAIVKGLAEAQAGRAWLDETDNQHSGAHFAFSVPLATTEELDTMLPKVTENVDIDISQDPDQLTHST